MIRCHSSRALFPAVSRVVVFADGEIPEAGAPDEIFTSPAQERTKLFLLRVPEQDR